MKRINFLVTDKFNGQIEELMKQLGLNIKSEFFRMLAWRCMQENKTPKKASIPYESLTSQEKALMAKIKNQAKTVDDLTIETGWPVSTISAMLVELLLKNCVEENGLYWQSNEF